VPGPSAGVHAVLALASGVGLVLAFPGVDWSGAAWVSLAPVLVIAVTDRPRLAFTWGLLAGWLFFLLLLRWLNFTFNVYSDIPWPLTWLPTAALAGYCGLYTGLVAAAVSWVARRRGPALALLAAPCFWVAAEWARGHLLGGFPWGNLGYSQHGQLPVIQVAELGGVYAVSFAVLAVNAALAGLATLDRRRALVGIGLAGAMILAVLGFGAWRLGEPAAAERATVTVMQPSIEQPLKWDPRHVEGTLATYRALTQAAAAGKPDLIVWPETASPTLLRQDAALLEELRDLAARAQVRLLVGSVDVDARTRAVFNTAFLVTGEGIAGRYDKIQLVPFGEYVPLSSVIGFVRGWAQFISELEPGSSAVVFPGPPAPFGVVICYEGIFPGLVRRFVHGGARLVVNMTNDAWFGRTDGPLQHLGMYSLRAVEHRTAIVRAANTGVSAFIAPSGRIVRTLGLYERGLLTDAVPLRQRQTLYTRLGDWLAHLSALASAGVLVAAFPGRPARGRAVATGGRA
jgi:apolipoprotein N-acyltransferase